MKNMKTGADDGLAAEMLKTNHAGLLQTIAEIFTEIVNGDCAPPDSWKMSKLRVIFKKGDTELPRTIDLYRLSQCLQNYSAQFCTDASKGL
jgi:hypothetical protein